MRCCDLIDYIMDETISPRHPDIIRGAMRTMTGVLLTVAGWAVFAQEEAKRKARKDNLGHGQGVSAIKTPRSGLGDDETQHLHLH
jgi:hypothetical protein